MQFALYRYMFEVMEPRKDSPTLPFTFEPTGFASPREAFAQKDALLDQLLLDDYKTLGSAEADALSADGSWQKSLLHFTSNRHKPLRHQYLTRPEEGFAILELARLSSVSHRPRPFQPKADKEDDYKSLHLIIDNRGTHQHVAIEVKPSVMKAEAVAQSLERALCLAFERYRLRVRVTPVRDSQLFWHLVGDRKRFPHGFKRLRVEFPQINDAETSERMRRAQYTVREMFGSNLVLVLEAPQGETLVFDKENREQRDVVNLYAETAKAIRLTPVGGTAFSLGGASAKTLQMSESERRIIEERNQQQELFPCAPTETAKAFMDKAYKQE